LLFWFLHMVPTHLNIIIIIIIIINFFSEFFLVLILAYGTYPFIIYYLYLYLYFPIYKTWCTEYNIKHIKWRERHISPPECAGQFVKDVFFFFFFFCGVPGLCGY
jgi:hypothetical protein